MPIEETAKFLSPNISNYEIAIASREAPGAVRYDEPRYRHLGGRLINLIIRLLILPGLQDTQCGFKCFRADVADDLFKRQNSPRLVVRHRITFYRPAARLSHYRDSH